ncbi:ParB/RepB/Spo0J family partition protein [Candidatus Gracilibacteria bacterium]|nr:ParB/RepB/Spo0J family partition protein [Candidatus Gracilibacteria bacterium]
MLTVPEVHSSLSGNRELTLRDGQTVTLLSPEAAPRDANTVYQEQVESLHPYVDQPRKYFDPQQLSDLARSISEKGLTYPIIVTPIQLADGSQTYLIVDGERRYRALKLLAPPPPARVLVVYFQDVAQLQLHSFLANDERQDHTAMEKAQFFRSMLDDIQNSEDVTQQAAMDVLRTRLEGRSKESSQYNNRTLFRYLQLLQLPLSLQEMVSRKQLTFTSATKILNAAHDISRKRGDTPERTAFLQRVTDIIAVPLNNEELDVDERHEIVTTAVKQALAESSPEKTQSEQNPIARKFAIVRDAIGVLMRGLNDLEESPDALLKLLTEMTEHDRSRLGAMVGKLEKQRENLGEVITRARENARAKILTATLPRGAEIQTVFALGRPLHNRRVVAIPQTHPSYPVLRAHIGDLPNGYSIYLVLAPSGNKIMDVAALHRSQVRAGGL